MNKLTLIKTERGISYNQEVLVNMITRFIESRELRITVACPKLTRRVTKDEKFWREVDRLETSSEPFIIVWPTNYLYTPYRCPEIKGFLDEEITASKPWINKL